MPVILSRIVATALLIIGLAGCQQRQAERPLPMPALPTYDAEAFFATTSYRGASISRDGQWVLTSSDTSGVYNLVKIHVISAEQVPLTDAQDTTYAVSWFKNDDRILFRRDNDGNERYHLYVLEIDGSSRDLTPGDNTRALFMGFSKNGEHFFVASNERDARFMDLYRYNSEDYSRQLLFTNPGGYDLNQVSSDGRYLVLAKANSARDRDLYLADLTKAEVAPRLFTAHKGFVSHSMKAFSSNNDKLYYTTDAHGEFTQVYSYDLTNGQHQPVLKADWDVSYLFFSESGRYRVHAINADARTRVTITDTQSGKIVALPEKLYGDISQVRFSADETLMTFFLSSDTSPRNLYSWKIGADTARKLTDALNPAINESQLVKSRVARFSSYDGLSIPGILYKPRQADYAPVPALVWVHGGPGGQSRQGYNPMIQHLVNHGYAVYAINNRGSSGYGKTFFHLDDKRHGDADLKDVIASKAFLANMDWIDGERIGIIGGSYGGYMTAAALTFYPKAFTVGINIFGVTNWVRTLTSIPPWWEAYKVSLYDEMGDPATDEARLRAISPLFHAHRIERPLMVIQGANDPRVLQIESDELVAAVRKKGVPVEYVLFEDEGHGFRKRKNRITTSDAMVRFLHTYLK